MHSVSLRFSISATHRQCVSRGPGAHPVWRVQYQQGRGAYSEELISSTTAGRVRDMIIPIAHTHKHTHHDGCQCGVNILPPSRALAYPLLPLSTRTHITSHAHTHTNAYSELILRNIIIKSLFMVNRE